MRKVFMKLIKERGHSLTMYYHRLCSGPLHVYTLVILPKGAEFGDGKSAKIVVSHKGGDVMSKRSMLKVFTYELDRL